MDKVNKNRLEFLDILRGIAIIMIVLGHMERGLVSAGVNSYYALILDTFLYSIHLPLMFILSGMVEGIFGKLDNNKISYKKYVKKNIISLYIPYIIFIYFYWFVKMYIFSGNGEASFDDFFHLFYNGKWVFWFLLSLLSIKIVHGMFEKYVKNKYICIVFFIIIYITSIFTKINVITWLSYGLFYSIGYFICKNNILKNYKKYLISFSLIIMIIGLSLMNFVDNSVQMILIGIPTSFLLLYLFYQKNCLKNIQICGKYSMVIYICHTLFTSLVRTLLIHIGITNFTFLLLLGTFFAIILSLLVVYGYKKIKILHFLEYLFYPNKVLE